MTDVAPRRAQPFSRLSVNLSIPLRERLDAAAEKSGEDISEIVRRGVEREVEEIEQRPDGA